MQVAYHLGAHCTDDDRLVRALMRAQAALAAQGVTLPAPRQYRLVIRDLLVALRGTAASQAEQEALLTAAQHTPDRTRLVFSHDFFLGIPQKVITPQGYYAGAGKRVAAIAGLLPGAAPEFHLSLCNPATQIPALISRIEGATCDSVLQGHDPRDLSWLAVVEDILATNPGLRLVVWCNEDTPLIWPEVLRRMAGVGPEVALAGEFDLLETIMSADGLARLRAYLATHPPGSAQLRRKVVTAFLDKFGLPDQIEVPVDLPGWTAETIDSVTALYDEDVARIAALPGVEFLKP